MTPTRNHEVLLASAPADLLAAEKARTAGDPAPAPEPALIVIERKPGWRFLDLKEIWRYRELLYFLVWRDIKVRYKQTALGAAWAVLQPLATMAAFALFLGRVAGADNSAIPYPLYVFAGLLPWTFFAAAVSTATASVVGNQNLVTKIYFPRLLMPFGAVTAAAFDLLVAFAMLLVLMPVFGRAPGWSFLALPLVVAVLLSLAAGLGVLLAAVTVTYRDVRAIVPLALQLWMFATPAIFLQAWEQRMGRMTPLLPLNPLHGVIVNFRAAAVGGDFDPRSLAASAAAGLALLAFGCLYFRRVERGFADVI